MTSPFRILLVSGFLVVGLTAGYFGIMRTWPLALASTVEIPVHLSYISDTHVTVFLYDYGVPHTDLLKQLNAEGAGCIASLEECNPHKLRVRLSASGSVPREVLEQVLEQIWASPYVTSIMMVTDPVDKALPS